MLHKISDFISKIRVIKDKADQLETMKYGVPKASQSAIDNMIQDIQAMCYMISQDRSEYNRLDEFSVKMRPMNYTMLQFIIDEPKMSFDDVKYMMEILDTNDIDTLLSYVSIMTSEKALVAKHIFDKRTKEAGMVIQ